MSHPTSPLGRPWDLSSRAGPGPAGGSFAARCRGRLEEAGPLVVGLSMLVASERGRDRCSSLRTARSTASRCSSMAAAAPAPSPATIASNTWRCSRRCGGSTSAQRGDGQRLLREDLLKVVDQAPEEHVAGRSSHGTMEIAVSAHGLLGRCRPLVPFETEGQLLEVLARPSDRRETRSRDLQAATYFVEVRGRVLADRDQQPRHVGGDKGTTAGSGLRQAESLKAPESLPDDLSTDAEATGQLGLSREPVVHPQMPQFDERDELRAHFLDCGSPDNAMQGQHVGLRLGGAAKEPVCSLVRQLHSTIVASLSTTRNAWVGVDR